jgi:hypothetical protein
VFHLRCLLVPPGVEVPQVEDHWSRELPSFLLFMIIYKRGVYRVRTSYGLLYKRTNHQSIEWNINPSSAHYNQERVPILAYFMAHPVSGRRIMEILVCYFWSTPTLTMLHVCRQSRNKHPLSARPIYLLSFISFQIPEVDKFLPFFPSPSFLPLLPSFRRSDRWS